MALGLVRVCLKSFLVYVFVSVETRVVGERRTVNGESAAKPRMAGGVDGVGVVGRAAGAPSRLDRSTAMLVFKL